jgi:hypothetical protein
MTQSVQAGIGMRHDVRQIEHKTHAKFSRMDEGPFPKEPGADPPVANLQPCIVAATADQHYHFLCLIINFSARDLCLGIRNRHGMFSDIAPDRP